MRALPGTGLPVYEKPPGRKSTVIFMGTATGTTASTFFSVNTTSTGRNQTGNTLVAGRRRSHEYSIRVDKGCLIAPAEDPNTGMAPRMSRKQRRAMWREDMRRKARRRR